MSQKFSPLLRIALDNGLKGETNILITVESPSNGVYREQFIALNDLGLTLHGSVGKVVSGSIDAGKLADLAALPFVESVEAGSSLFPEKNP